MPDEERHSRHARIWMLDLTIALAAALVAMIFALGWLADDSCVDAGGTVVKAGEDGFCRFPDGRVEPLSLGFTRIGWAAAAVAWMAITLILYWSGRRFIHHHRPADHTQWGTKH
jgi:hypothetical protein